MCSISNFWLLVSIHISIFLLRAGTSITNIEVTADVMLNVKLAVSISNVGSRSCMLNVVGNWCIWLLVSIHISIFLLRAGTSITNIEVAADVMLNVKLAVSVMAGCVFVKTGINGTSLEKTVNAKGTDATAVVGVVRVNITEGSSM